MPLKPPNYKDYLGDAVYIQLDEINRIVLTTEDGYSANNTIILEPEVISALLGYIEKTKELHNAK